MPGASEGLGFARAKANRVMRQGRLAVQGVSPASRCTLLLTGEETAGAKELSRLQAEGTESAKHSTVVGWMGSAYREAFQALNLQLTFP